MSRCKVRPMAAEDVSAAAQLAAGRQRRLKGIVADPALDYADAALCEAEISDLLSRGDGFVAEAGGAFIGYLLGSHRNGFGFCPSLGHALAPSVDATSVYGGLFTALADLWLSSGVTIYDIETPVDSVIESAWFDLGFGRRTCIASMQPKQNGRERSQDLNIEVRIADDGDFESIARLELFETQFRSVGPYYGQPMGTTFDQVRAHHVALAVQGGVHLLARMGGRDVGVLAIEPVSSSPVLNGKTTPFIGPTSVDPAVRGGGIGQALVAGALDWCEANDKSWIGVAFNTPNLMSRPFWLGVGFHASGWKLARRLPPGLAARL